MLSIEGMQSLPPQNKPLWDTDYFKLALFLKEENPLVVPLTA